MLFAVLMSCLGNWRSTSTIDSVCLDPRTHSRADDFEIGGKRATFCRQKREWQRGCFGANIGVQHRGREKQCRQNRIYDGQRQYDGDTIYVMCVPH